MTRVGVLVLVVAMAAHSVIAQQPLTIRGRVLAADNQQPLRRARVATGHNAAMAPPGFTPPDGAAVLTDDDGRFDIAIPASTKTLVVSKGGFATATYEIDRAAQREQEIGIRLSKGGAVSGRMTRSSGDPIRGARVFARRLDAKVDPASVAAAGETDDRGEFRLYGLLQGRYEISPEPLPAAMRMVLAQISSGSRTPPVMTPELLRGLRQPPPSSPPDPARSIVIDAGSEVGPMDLHVATAELPDIPPNVLVTRDANGGLQEVRVPCPTCAPAAGQLDDVERPNGVISGTVLDHAGEPFQGIRIEALRLERRGMRMVATRKYRAGPTTDDRGRYRLSDLVPGEYLIVASTDAAASGLDRQRGEHFTKIYFPGTPSLESAQTIRVDERQDVSGMDLTFRPTRAVRIAGAVRDISGEPLVGQVRLIASERSGAIAVDPVVNRVDWDGRFEFLSVPPGDYVVQAVGTNPERRNEFGLEYVSVGDTEPEPLAIVTSTGTTLEGRFVVEGGRQVPRMRFLNLHAAPNDLDVAPAEGRGPDGLSVFDEGRFSMTGLRGSMRLTVGELPSGWYLKSISIGGLDVTDRPFDFGVAEQTITGAEVLFGTSAATIAGMITDRDPRSASVAIVIAFPRSRELWFEGSRYLRVARSDTDGAFAIDGLPAGEYGVVALDRWPTTEWQFAGVLEALLPLATRVTLAEGQALSTDLRLRRRVP